MVKIRLQRHGKKEKPFYHVVVADARAPRDGRFIEKLGTYNPITNPAEVTIDVDRSLVWLENGAQPTETVKAIFSYKGVLYKKHLKRGVLKGSFDEEELKKRFDVWIEQKNRKIQAKVLALSTSKNRLKQEKIKVEIEKSESRFKVKASKD